MRNLTGKIAVGPLVVAAIVAFQLMRTRKKALEAWPDQRASPTPVFSSWYRRAILQRSRV